MKIYIITDTEAGWDCVRGVYNTKQAAIKMCAEMEEVNPDEWDEGESRYIIHEKRLQD